MLFVFGGRKVVTKVQGRRVRRIAWTGAAVASDEFGVDVYIRHVSEIGGDLTASNQMEKSLIVASGHFIE